MDVALLVIRMRRTGISLKREDFRLRRTTIAGLLRVGFPVAIQDGLIQIAFLVITVIANQRGLNDAAAVGIVEKLICILFLVPSSMLSTVSALSAQNIGAGHYDRARLTLRYAIMIAVGWGILVCIVMQISAETFVGLFTSDGEEVVRLGSQYLRGYVFDCIFAGIHFSFSGYFCGCGKSGISFLHNFLAIVCARIPLVYLASRMFADTLLPMGLATSAGSLLSVIICVCAYLWMERRRKRVSPFSDGRIS